MDEEKLDQILSMLARQSDALDVLTKAVNMLNMRMDAFETDLRLVHQSTLSIGKTNVQLATQLQEHEGTCADATEHLSKRVRALEAELTPIPKPAAGNGGTPIE